MYYAIYISSSDSLYLKPDAEAGWYVAKFNDNQVEIIRDFGKFDSYEEVSRFIDSIKDSPAFLDE
jgi:hypothetical protein